jgi:hypothetical protein
MKRRCFAVPGAILLLIAAGCTGPAVAESPSTTPVEQPLAPSEIGELVASMQTAVGAADLDAYLALVDLSDPVFALEHTRLADDWGPNPVDQYRLQLAHLVVADETATGQLTVTWALQGDDAPRTATFAVRFTHAPSGWRYAGEDWISTKVPHFAVMVAPGLEDAVPAIVADLPGIYDHVTTTLDYEPAASMEIKLYADAAALVANTMLSLPEIHGWNEPGESLKLRIDPEFPSLSPAIAHEFTHFVGFDRAGTHRSLMPWWLDEGLATFVGAAYEAPERAADRLAQVVAWQAADELAPWDEMAVFETTPRELWQFAYAQGYAMVRYVTRTYGDEARNAWLAAMATEMTIDGATPAALGVSFDELDADFRQWLEAP